MGTTKVKISILNLKKKSSSDVGKLKIFANMSNPPRPPYGPPMQGGGPPGGPIRPPGYPVMGPRPPGQMVNIPPRQSPGMMAPPAFAKRPMGHPGGPGGPGGPPMQGGGINKSAKKKKKLADKILPQKVRELVPESQAYMYLLAFERKLDSTIMRKRLDIQEALKRPMKQKRKLRIFISNTSFPAAKETQAGPDGTPQDDGSGNSSGGATTAWELRVEGRLIAEEKKVDPSKSKRKFSSFFKSLVIELDKDLYGPDNHLVEWRRTATTQETDGFQVKRPGDKNVRCTILLLLDYQPLQFKLDQRLARLLGVHTQTRPVIISALWQYINCAPFLRQIFQADRMKFAEIPQRLNPLLHPPDPIVVNHLITVEGQAPEQKKTACYDIDVEVDDTLKVQMNSFLLSTNSQMEIQNLDNKIHETVETIQNMKTQREFYLSFSKDPQLFINKWLISQSRDLKMMTDVAGNPEEERRTDFYYQPWASEAVCRYFYQKIQQKRAELDSVLGLKSA